MPSLDLHSFLEQFLYDPKNPLLFNNGFFICFFTMFICLYYNYRNNYKVRKYIFCFFSLYFFYKASGYFVIFVIISAVVDFILSNAIYKYKNKKIKVILLITSIFFNLGMLFYFKYTNFFISVSNDFFSTHFNLLNILLPVGISFYTFENISYIIDVYRGELQPTRKFSEYLLFLSFFPKLVMGPIVRAHDFIPQISKPYRITEKDFTTGFYLIISGMFKKLIISDYLSVNIVNFVFDDPSRYSGLENLLAVYCYAVVIYCDFSGYSDVAIGIARWLGFSIPPNFLSPYQSKNITEFWRRWHISLSTWLKDYVYIPLGGNRKGTIITYIFASSFFIGIFIFQLTFFKFPTTLATAITVGLLLFFILPAIIDKKYKGISTSFNLITLMLLGGFWHGANYNFIIWGSLHGIALIIHKIWMRTSIKIENRIKLQWWYKLISIFITFHFICFTWIFFKSTDFTIATTMLHQILHNFSFNIWQGVLMNYKFVILIMIFAYLLHSLPDKLSENIIERFSTKMPMIAYVLCFFIFIVLYSFFKSAEPVMPIYLQF